MDSNEEVLKALALLAKQQDKIENMVQNISAELDKITKLESYCQDVTGGGGTTSIMKGRLDCEDFDDIEEQAMIDTPCSCVLF